MLVQVDGAARGNPGPSSVAWVIKRDGAILDKGGQFIGEGTNNRAEWMALIRGAKRVRELGYVTDSLTVESDSELVVNQYTGVYACNKTHLRELRDKAEELLSDYETVTVKHIPREQNALADGLANKALDEHGF